MTAREKRLMSDYEQVKKDFTGHKNIIVTPIGGEPPEQYKVTYFVNGIYLGPDGSIQTQARHEVEITLHADYPRYKPLCKINTPIWHPNFRDGQICIGDVWGAGESLSDIIINIGDMIQYKEWNSYSPLSADAAKWAIDNKHLFPVGNINLNVADISDEVSKVEIDLFGETGEIIETQNESQTDGDLDNQKVVQESVDIGNDFDITAEELEGIEFIPTPDRMQTLSTNGMVKVGVNFKTVFLKGIMWALIGGVVGFILQEILNGPTDSLHVLKWLGATSLYDVDTSTIKNAVRISTGIFSALVALSLGLFMGIGEGVFYGSKENTTKFAAMGAGISVAIGFVSGYLAQMMYAAMLDSANTELGLALVRGLGWSLMGVGIGLSIGLIKPDKKRILYCALGGLGGGFVGGFIFNFITGALSTGEDDTGIIPRAIGIIIMGALIGLGIGLLEQFAKQAWLKVVRGEFEGKEYLVFSGTTSIGNNGKNTIVLFKDKLVGPHHCDIVQEGGKYVLVDCGTPMGTVVNGMRIQRHVLQQGDTIAIGNSVLVFNSK